MATSLADPPAAPDAQQPASPPGTPPSSDGAATQRKCANCGAPLAAEQDWCLQCGAGVPGSVQARAHRWRAGAAVLSAVALLVAGAAVAAYAALSKSTRKTTALVLVPAQPAAAPGAATPQPPTASSTPTPAAPRPGGSAPTVKPHVPLVKPPKIPLAATTVKTPAATTTPSASPTTTTPASKGSPGASGSSGAAEKQPAALILDTNAASTYNPYSYPASSFGDPSLAIDGEASTAWTALVEPSVAPKMAEGLLIDLKGAQRLSALTLTSSTPGMTVQVYATTAHTAPSSITDPAWVRLSGLLVNNKRTTRITLGHSKQAFYVVVLWISKAPASAVGTPHAPGHVRVNELELFPAA